MYFEAFEEGFSALLKDYKILSMRMSYTFFDDLDKRKNEYVQSMLSSVLGKHVDEISSCVNTNAADNFLNDHLN